MQLCIASTVTWALVFTHPTIDMAPLSVCHTNEATCTAQATGANFAFSIDDSKYRASCEKQAAVPGAGPAIVSSPAYRK